MAKADHDDTSSPYEWVSPHEYVRRIAGGDPAAETEAQYSVEERFRRGEIHHRYRAGDGKLHHDDLSDDFRGELVVDFVTATATRPGRTIREENPDYPSVSDPLRPKTPQWFGADPQSRGWNPFSRPEYIDRELPAETITELRFLAPRAAVGNRTTKHSLLLDILKDIDEREGLASNLLPAQVEKKVLGKFRPRWAELMPDDKTDPPVSRREINRTYQSYLETRGAK